MEGIPSELVLPTLSVRAHGSLIVFVNRAGVEIADADWRKYVEWAKAMQARLREIRILTAPGGSAPTSAQRSLFSREVNTDYVRMAILLSDPKLLAIVRVTSWFMRNTAAFKAHEVEQALEFLNERNAARVRLTIRELGGVVHTAAI